MSPTPEDSRYRDALSPPCPTLVVDNVSPDISAEALTAIFAKVGLPGGLCCFRMRLVCCWACEHAGGIRLMDFLVSLWYV